MSVEKSDEGSGTTRTLNHNGTFVQSVDRAISVMEFLSRQGWSGVTEVAGELDIHKSTAYRLLSTLKERRLVEQDAVTEKYRLGFGVVLLASAFTEDIDIVRHARPARRRLGGAPALLAFGHREPYRSATDVTWFGINSVPHII